jgi:hypothetical protein
MGAKWFVSRNRKAAIFDEVLLGIPTAVKMRWNASDDDIAATLEAMWAAKGGDPCRPGVTATPENVRRFVPLKYKRYFG